MNHFHFAWFLAIYCGLTLLGGELATADEPATNHEPAKDTAAPPAAPQAVTFDGQTLDLAWQGGDAQNPIHEYIPSGETLDNWTHLASIRGYAELPDPQALAAKTLEVTRATYANTPSEMLTNPTSGDAIIDFVAWPADRAFLEYNVFQYTKRAGGGTVAYQYAIRVYAKDMDSFLNNLTAIRQRLVNEMATHGLPAAE